MTESKSIKCRFCDSLFVELKRFESHLVHDHKEINSTEKIEEFKKAKELIILNNKDEIPLNKFRKSKKDLKKNQKKIKPTYIPITISSRKGIKVRLETVCSSCSKSYRIVWKYNNTSIGLAHLCYSCKNRIIKTHNPIRIVYSNPESNRNKY